MFVRTARIIYYINYISQTYKIYFSQYSTGHSPIRLPIKIIIYFSNIYSILPKVRAEFLIYKFSRYFLCCKFHERRNIHYCISGRHTQPSMLHCIPLPNETTAIRNSPHFESEEDFVDTHICVYIYIYVKDKKKSQKIAQDISVLQA